MVIGFGNGAFYRINKNELDRFSESSLKALKLNTTNAIELHCLNESMIDFLFTIKNSSLDGYDYISLHTPDLPYQNDESSNRIIAKLQSIAEKININNIVFHVDKVIDWNVLQKYQMLPISIENSDSRKSFGRTIQDMKLLLDKYNFGFTLDLQHCFENDPTMKLADDFQTQFKHRIVQCHLSGHRPQSQHYPLYITKQNIIIEHLKYKNTPIIIESTFDTYGEQADELNYILQKIYAHSLS